MGQGESVTTAHARRAWWIGGLLVAVLLLVGFFLRHPILEGLTSGYRWVVDREKLERLITAFGNWGPLAFMGLQILQVVLAPIPGEATGFIGGYLFGTVQGFLYSSAALTVGSWINFLIGRYLGKRFVRNWIPADKWARLDQLVKRQGIVVLLILFVFPGFPKDYLCLFLGVTTLPLKAFLLIAALGRMPGTLMLSLKGEFLFRKNYLVFSILLGVVALVALLSVRYREKIYAWIEKLDQKSANGR